MFERLGRNIFGHPVWLSSRMRIASPRSTRLRWWNRGSRLEAFHRLHQFRSGVTSDPLPSTRRDTQRRFRRCTQ